MHCRWCWGCLAGLFMLQVVLLWWWLPAASVAPPSIAQPQPALSKECHAALTALETTKGELFYRVATARLMVADYARLRRDFLRLHSMSDEAIDAWLLDEVAFLSSNHFAHEYQDPPPGGAQKGSGPYRRKVHTAPQRAIDKQGVPIARNLSVVRPPRYDRAAVFILSRSGEVVEMLDVKGVGLVPPNPPISQAYLTGVLPIYEAVAEFMWATVVQRILDESGSNVRVLPHYAVIDLGFDIVVYPNTTWLSPAKGTVGAALLVRAAHCREGTHRMTNNESLLLEKTFRRYGLSTCAGRLYRGSWACALNYQGSTDKQLLDLAPFKTLQPDQWDWPVVVDDWQSPDREMLVVDLSGYRPDARLMVNRDDYYWGLSGEGSTRAHRRLYHFTLALHKRWQRGAGVSRTELLAEIEGAIMQLPFMS
ncbi:uncharacterized protein ACA1_327380 [Acanthamoeba castellanii str. Neff]|uniref:Uncharacterized protein n=1 Tax=Acanthamoeba castellanii (strain ATCC 30010 / Neff) TaxID=1257118 RepID=L8GNC9_ACACF|nr:uncharacterized protein ACA1_327380 [Acanthamoeba castellanii str. Neff]ELR14253.1 hypothetical protein ACA1_327380 [Acanthamoeba castellanii str. Neff]